MNIIVCVKQVPDTTEVKIDPVTNTLIRSGVPSIVNPFDKNAVEAALQLKENYGGSVKIITMGPPQAKEALKECLAMGADEAVLISDRAFAGADTWATSYTLANAIKHIGEFDLIMCGKQAIDGDTAQVGPGIAEWLDISQITYVQKINSCENGIVQAERVIEGGYEVITATLPTMISVEKSINEPRFPTLKGTRRAGKAEIPTLTANDIQVNEELVGLKGSPTFVKRIFTPELRSKGQILKGEPRETSKVLAEKIINLKII
jgi:electron transfer flavoprotein beta subunit